MAPSVVRAKRGHFGNGGGVVWRFGSTERLQQSLREPERRIYV